MDLVPTIVGSILVTTPPCCGPLGIRRLLGTSHHEERRRIHAIHHHGPTGNALFCGHVVYQELSTLVIPRPTSKGSLHQLTSILVIGWDNGATQSTTPTFHEKSCFPNAPYQRQRHRSLTKQTWCLPHEDGTTCLLCRQHAKTRTAPNSDSRVLLFSAP